MILGYDPSSILETSTMHEEPIENPIEIESRPKIEVHPTYTYIPKFLVGSINTNRDESPKEKTSSLEIDNIEE